MMTRLFILICYFGICHLNAQNIDKDLLEVQHRLDTIQSFSALVELNVDISFINIPVKHAKIEYTKNEETKVFSEDFVLIPKNLYLRRRQTHKFLIDFKNFKKSKSLV